VWQKFHILSRAQVFIVAQSARLCLRLLSRLFRFPLMELRGIGFLAPLVQLDPFINFGAVFVSALPLFIGYYHLARLGALLGFAASTVTFFATQVCAGSIFVFQVVGRSLMVQ
jgi:hypothetical protein